MPKRVKEHVPKVSVHLTPDRRRLIRKMASDLDEDMFDVVNNMVERQWKEHVKQHPQEGN